MWQIFPLLETFRSNLALCSCWFSQYFLKCSRILWGAFFKDGKMWWHENLFHFMKSQQPSLVNKTLVWHRSSWKPSSYSLEPDWFLDVWNRHILGLLLGYCFSSVAKVGGLFRSLWDFVASVRWCQESCAQHSSSCCWWRGWSTQWVVPRAPRSEELCCPDREPSAQPWTQVSQHWALFSCPNSQACS